MTAHGRSDAMTARGHRPVLLEAVIAALNPRANAIYVDGTFGGGGYSRAMLEAADCRVWGIDRDPEACERAQAMARDYGGRLAVLCGRFGEMDLLLARHGVAAVDGIALDLGVSSWQLDEPGRGFSFRQDGPLDMRMSRQGPSAAEIVNTTPEDALADIIWRYGEERRSRRIARAIAAARAEAPITRTRQLAEIVRQCHPPADRRPGAATIDPATRTFQALRIHVNDELGEIARGLCAAEALLGRGGRLAVVSFHSLEDRIVKSFLRERSGMAGRGSRHAPDRGAAPHAPTFATPSRRPVKPGAREVADNPRARSARLRTAERTAAAPWPRAAGDAPGNALGGAGGGA